MGKKKPLKEVMRENKRMITRAVRELDREKQGLEKEEQRLTMEIKKAARANQMGSVKIMAKDLVRTRQYITKFIEMRSHLQGCALKLQTVKSHQAMAEAMNSTAQAMHKMNKAVNVSSITKMMAEFEKENAKTEMMQGTLMLLDRSLSDFFFIIYCYSSVPDTLRLLSFVVGLLSRMNPSMILYHYSNTLQPIHFTPDQ